MRTRISILIFVLNFIIPTAEASSCRGHFVNPLTDICWRCLFPLSIGSMSVLSSGLGDTPNAEKPVGFCPSKIGTRIGLNIGYWEPVALAEVTDTPYCLVNLGGHVLNLGLKSARGGSETRGQGQIGAFYHVHWYKYPLISWLNIITSAGCHQGGDFDVAYMTELDPAWKDSEMSFVLNPEAALFGNAMASSSCAADSISSTALKKPNDELFWCAGSQGIHYPLTGHVNAPVSPVQTALLLTERLNFKLHREGLIKDSSPLPGAICSEHKSPVTPKSRYRYEMVNQIADGKHCYPSGYTTLAWEANKIKPHTQSQYGFLIWRKRNCTFL